MIVRMKTIDIKLKLNERQEKHKDSVIISFNYDEVES